MRRTKELQWRWYLLAGAVTIGMILLLALSSDRFAMVSHAESAAKVTATSANIRKEPSSSSATIGSTEKDKVISIKSQVQGADGYTWYEVYVNADTLGYIRSDLVQITDGTTPPTGTAPAASTPAPASAATPIPDEPLVDVTAVNPASASVTGGDSVRVRQNASTTSRILDQVKSGMALTITGTADGKDGKVWYQVTYSSNGTETTGFIRSDYTTVKPEDLTPYTEEPSADEPTDTEEPPADTEEPAPAGTEGYGAVFQNDKWWLVDYEGKHADAPGQGFEIEEMFNAVSQNKTLLEESEKTVKTQKIILVLMVILLVGAAAAITLLIFKVKDMTDAQYFNEVERDTMKRRSTRPQGSGQKTAQTAGGSRPAGTRSAGAQGQRPQGSRPAGASQGQKPQGSRPAGASQGQRPQGSRPAGASQGTRPAGTQGQQPHPASQGTRPSGTAQGQQRPASQGQRPQGNRPAQGQQSPGWQSKNFMADEDEFEFEFLNYDGDEQK
ncbi:MAG: SH3 domain-containing protein [Blautia sp.]|nr:SH3 domain-containing protein [Blautia sp.]